MHHHADRAVISVRRSRMHVRNLYERQQRKQNQTDERSGAHSPELAVGSMLQISVDLQTHLHLLQAYTRLDSHHHIRLSQKKRLRLQKSHNTNFTCVRLN